jgi:hypothetical protein
MSIEERIKKQQTNLRKRIGLEFQFLDISIVDKNDIIVPSKEDILKQK